MACAREIQTIARLEKCVSICCDGQAALEALRTAKTTSPLVQQSERVLNDISTRHTVGLLWVPGHSGVRRYEIADKLVTEGTVQQFAGPEPALGVSRQNLRREIKRCIDNQHMAMWPGLIST